MVGLFDFFFFFPALLLFLFPSSSSFSSSSSPLLSSHSRLPSTFSSPALPLTVPLLAPFPALDLNYPDAHSYTNDYPETISEKKQFLSK